MTALKSVPSVESRTPGCPLWGFIYALTAARNHISVWFAWNPSRKLPISLRIFAFTPAKSPLNATFVTASSPSLHLSLRTCAHIMGNDLTDATFVPRPLRIAALLPNTCARILEKSHTNAISVFRGFPSQGILIAISAFTWTCEKLLFEPHKRKRKEFLTKYCHLI